MVELLDSISPGVWGAVIAAFAFLWAITQPIRDVEKVLERVSGQLGEIRDLLEPVSEEAEESLYDRRDPPLSP